jgi:hypothetical protein
VDPVEFMRRVWGNEGPKAKKEKNGSDVTSEVDGEGEEGSDVTSEATQSGGSKFNAPLNPEKGKPAADFQRRFKMQAESEFFGSPEYTDEAKLAAAEELKGYFEHQIKILSGRIARNRPPRPRIAGGFPPIEIPTQKEEI